MYVCMYFRVYMAKARYQCAPEHLLGSEEMVQVRPREVLACVACAGRVDRSGVESHPGLGEVHVFSHCGCRDGLSLRRDRLGFRLEEGHLATDIPFCIPDRMRTLLSKPFVTATEPTTASGHDPNFSSASSPPCDPGRWSWRSRPLRQ